MPSSRQRAKIFAASKELGLSKEQLYDVVEQVSGGRSVSHLSDRHTLELLDALVRAGARPRQAPRARRPAGAAKASGRRTAPNEVLMITAAQRDLIDDLRSKLGGRWSEDPYFEGACTRLIRKPRPTTASNGERVIEMLKARLAHDRRKAAGA